MNQKIAVRLRLSELLDERGASPEDLSEATGLSLQRIQEYCAGDVDSVSLADLGAMLSALGCSRVTDILEEIVEADVPQEADDTPPMMESDWYSPCPASSDGKHRWCRDAEVSDTVYQEFRCMFCRRRLSVIL